MKMPTLWRVGLVVGSLFLFAPSVHAAKPVLFSWGGEHITKVADFPDTEQFRMSAGTHIDPGYRYKQVQVFFVPLWNYDGAWCGYVGQSNGYLDLDKATLDELAKSVGISLGEIPQLPFWDAYGGKLVFVFLLAAGIVYAKLTS